MSIPRKRSARAAFESRQSELQRRLAHMMVAEAVRALHAQQESVGYIRDDLSRVEFFRLLDEHSARMFIAQFNPKRAERFNVPGAGTQAGCALCVDSIFERQGGLQHYYTITLSGTRYHVLCNPYAFNPSHVTIVHAEHRPQAWQCDEAREDDDVARLAAHLCVLAGQLPTFIVIYNGVDAGASLPHHRHFQAFEVPCGHGDYPLQIAARLVAKGRTLTVIDESVGYPIPAFRVTGDASDIALQLARLMQRWTKLEGKAASANIIVLHEAGALAAYFVPRNRLFRRAAGLAGPIGALETLGEFVLSTQGDADALREGCGEYRYLWRSLRSIAPASAGEVHK